MRQIQTRIRGLKLSGLALALAGPLLTAGLAGASDIPVKPTWPLTSSSNDSAFAVEFDSTAERVRLLQFEGWGADAESLATRFLEEIEERFGSESLETAESMDLAVWAALPGGNPMNVRDRRQANRVRDMAVQALSIKELLMATEDSQLVPSLDNMARVEYVLVDTVEAQRHAERSLAIRESVFGPEHPEVARSLRLLGIILLRIDYEATTSYLERALQIQEASLKPDDLEIATTLATMAACTYRVGPEAQARERDLYRRSLEIVEARLGSRHYRVAVALTQLADAYMVAGIHQEAEPLYERAIEVAQATVGPQHPLMGSLYNNFGALYYNTLFDPDKAVRYLERSLTVTGENWITLSNLGLTYSLLARREEARDRFERAIANAESSLGPGNTWTGLMYQLYGLDLVLAEDAYLEAERLLQRSIDIHEAIPTHNGNSLRNWAWTVASQAELATRIGEPTKARELYERGVEMIDRSFGEVNHEPGQVHDMYASMLARNGDYRSALEQHLLAKATLERFVAPDHPFVIDNLQGRAEMHAALGETEEARRLFSQCLEIRERKQGKEHPGVSATLISLALLEREDGQLDKAWELLERAAAIQAGVYGDSDPQLAASLSLLSELALAQGDHEAALANAISAEQASRGHLRRTAEGLTERRALAYARVRNSGLNCALTVLSSESDPYAIPTAWNEVIRSRGLILDEMAARHRALGVAGDAEAESLVIELRRARTRLANLAIRSAGMRESGSEAAGKWGQLSPEQLRLLLDEATQDRERAEAALTERSLAFRQERAQRDLGYREVSGLLPGDAALVSIVCYEPVNRQSGGSDMTTHYAAFVLRGDDEQPLFVALGDAAVIDAAVSRWRTEASRAELDEVAYREAGKTLRRRVWDSLAPQLDDVELVFIVPDGALHLINWSALPAETGGYLVESGPTIHYLSAERDLALQLDRTAEGEGLLAFGDPRFNERVGVTKHPEWGASGTYRGTRAACGDFRSIRFAPLPATAQEVHDVCERWSQTQRAEQALVGNSANEAAFKTQTSGHRVVHVATHGFFLGGECHSALEGHRGVGGVATVEAPPADLGENPLLLSGLALAGANRREEAGSDEEDGILTAEEIASLDLTGVEWAVLSACETGVGEVRAGEGVFGLRRAFQVAGARTLIMSLWSVEDDATRNWMKHLYEARLVDGLDTAESVRQASLRTLSERRANGLSTSPFYWGAFVAAGDWR